MMRSSSDADISHRKLGYFLGIVVTSGLEKITVRDACEFERWTLLEHAPS